MYQQIKIRFDFKSLLAFSALIGFCAGVVSIVLQLFGLFTGQDFSFGSFLVVALLSSLMGLVNGFLLGLFAYPFYWYITKKIGFTFTGTFHAVE